MRSEPRNARTPVWALSISLAATLEIEFSFFSSGYLDVSVHRVPSVSLCIHDTVHEVFSCGFPHSDICGSMHICSSPQLFAAYHVFHRLLVPRHPPCALISLTFHIHSVECAVSCLCPSCDGFSYFYFVFYLETDLTPSSSDVFFFCLQKILPLFSGALFLRQVLRFLFLLYSVFKVPVWPAVSSDIKIRKSLTDFHRCKTKWRWRDSNSWPPACKAGALPTELHPRFILIHGLKWTRTIDLTLIRRAL